MPYDPTDKRVLPRTKDDLHEIEKRITQLHNDFREIRIRMNDFGMETVDLALKTFLLRIEQAEELTQLYLGKVMAQSVTHKRARIERAEAAADAEHAKRKPKK